MDGQSFDAVGTIHPADPPMDNWDLAQNLVDVNHVLSKLESKAARSWCDWGRRLVDPKEQILSEILVRSETKDSSLEAHLFPAVQAVSLSLGCRPRTLQEGASILGLEALKLVIVGAEVFTLVEASSAHASLNASLWRHSLRTAYLAGLIAKGEGARRDNILQASTAGFLHDLGLLVLVSLFPEWHKDVRGPGPATNLVTFQNGTGTVGFLT